MAHYPYAKAYNILVYFETKILFVPNITITSISI